MNESAKSSIKPISAHEQFRTPRRPITQSSSRATKSTTHKRKPSPPSSLSERRSKRVSLPVSSTAQSTLTQIDFVTQTPISTNDELDYIEHAGSGASRIRQDDKPVHIGHGSDGESEYKSPGPILKGISRLGTRVEHPKRRAKSGPTQRASLRSSLTPAQSKGKGKRKFNDKPPSKRDKTLTQMDFVRRYITIDDDDAGVDMAYIKAPSSLTPRGGNVSRDEKVTQDSEPKISPPPSKGPWRIRAATDLSASKVSPEVSGKQGSARPSKSPNTSALDTPITPRKFKRLEIPSSQSPESPGLAIITSSQFRSATRSPQRRSHPKNTDTQKITKKEFSDEEVPFHEHLEADQSHDTTPSKSQSGIIPPLALSSQVVPCRALSVKLSPKSPAVEHSSHNSSQVPRDQRERTVVYETDADTDNEDFGDDPDSPSKRQLTDHANSPLIDTLSDTPHDDDSEDLPLPSGNPTIESETAPASEAFMSDASMFYRRQQPATQFPHEPIPMLNTQKMTELFPKDAICSPVQPIPLSSQTQGMEQVEIVPESSPARSLEKNAESRSQDLFQRPRLPGSVIQVQSSQPVEGGRPNALLSRSQLLTSSVMESVPMPNFWPGSQDSVGEPYSLSEA
ncbi:hypothetical protein N7539_000979 [Penicillium diatomitis]|uniref:Uncharacterized protein n=1 Tax=Penicillium diatomitis TaxID=2819901 RepID=A0A9X0C2P1_9EURO|nr:uncharacterized protein N7539_000979 [Penicillium diatomitis]KAJ5495863.1 hypothetical protein N7539_000979 [Penicillium diatomitis]